MPTETYIEGPRYPVTFDHLWIPETPGYPFIDFLAHESLGGAIGHTRDIIRADFDGAPRRRFVLQIKCLMSRLRLLEIVKKNREQHAAMHVEALKGFFARSREALLKAEAEYAAEHTITFTPRFIPPTHHLDDYDRAIKMLELTESPIEIELTEEDFATLVMDDWDWTHSWLRSNKGFSPTCASYAKEKGLD